MKPNSKYNVKRKAKLKLGGNAIHGGKRANSRQRRDTPSFSPIPTRIAEVVTRDLSDGWHPIGIIEARIKGRFCDVRTVCSTGVNEIIRTYYQEEVNRASENKHESYGEAENDDIPF